MKDLSTSPDYTENFSANVTFDSILAARLSRRALLKGSLAAAAALYVGTDATAATRTLKLNFKPVAKSRADILTVPAGYSWSVLLRTGDPLDKNTDLGAINSCAIFFLNLLKYHNLAVLWIRC